jgi:ACS family hexuronate transporter-like MFS transporter
MRLRWVAAGIFVVSNVVNYLDRGILASVWPDIASEYHLDERHYGWIVMALSLSYALASPVTGWMLDRLGLTRGISIAVAVWSAAAAATGAVSSFPQLLLCRIGLGAGESAGIPAVGKANAMYLQPKERAIGAALSQVGISIGGILAPVLAVLFVARSWRFPFVVAGVCGLLWIPLWWLTARRIRPQFDSLQPAESPAMDKRLIALVTANVLWMGVYSLWTNWTSLYLFGVHHLSKVEAAKYAWAPPLFSVLGGFLGGWASMRMIDRGVPTIDARLRAILLSAVGVLTTLVVPFTPTPFWSIAAIAMSFFWATAGSVNLYAIPLDLYGASRAGASISALVFAYGLLQTVISPAIGCVVKYHGYMWVCVVAALPPLIGYWLLRRTLAPQ